MSVQFGTWNLDGRPLASSHLKKVTEILALYGPDGGKSYIDKNVSILYHAFHTTRESHLETQPHISASGDVITWNGRLDNRAEVANQLRDLLAADSTDVDIVAAAYDKYSTNCFAKFIGDWALSIWNPKNRSLVLAKDPIGTRHLYYVFDKAQVAWSTVLEPLVRLEGKTFPINQEYIAGWLSLFPATHLTPYVGIHSVPPSCFVLLRPGKHTVSKYWDFDPKSMIRYRTDAEYEAHFRSVFAEAVQRRLRSDRPVLAELSGGRDSSSIVCMADAVLAQGAGHTPRLDTISYFDDDEPNWNERPYFTKVEQKRGRVGWHVNVGMQPPEHSMLQPSCVSHDDGFVFTPGSDGRTSKYLRACLASQGNRVVLSGIGGDEVTGGVPTPIPELEDLLARAQLRALIHQLRAWALEKRKPWFYLFWNAVRDFLPLTFVGVPKHMRPAPWLQHKFVDQHRSALTGYHSRTKLFGPLPTFQDNVSTLHAIRRQLAHTPLTFDPPYEKRYPFLDRTLLEFMFAIPRAQSVRPTQRRSLMRRALVGMVPDEILNRKGKAFVSRSPRLAISRDWTNLVQMTQEMVSGSFEIVDAAGVLDALQKARSGEEVHVLSLMRTVDIEGWLRKLCTLGFVNIDMRRFETA